MQTQIMEANHLLQYLTQISNIKKRDQRATPFTPSSSDDSRQVLRWGRSQIPQESSELIPLCHGSKSGFYCWAEHHFPKATGTDSWPPSFGFPFLLQSELFICAILIVLQGSSKISKMLVEERGFCFIWKFLVIPTQICNFASPTPHFCKLH